MNSEKRDKLDEIKKILAEFYENSDELKKVVPDFNRSPNSFKIKF